MASGFLRPEGGGPDLFLNNREMQRLMHGDYALVQPTEIDRKGRQEARLVRLFKVSARRTSSVAISSRTASVSCGTRRQPYRPGHHHPGRGEQGARQSQVVVLRINQRATARFQRGRHRIGKCWVKTWPRHGDRDCPCVPTASRTLGPRR